MGRIAWAMAFLATIPVANWMIDNVGTVCVEGGPCLLPVAPGVMAPSGVYVIGVAFVLRDIVHLTSGRNTVLAAIVLGAALSAAVNPALALASGVAFLVSELLDFAIYAPLARNRFTTAVLASSLVGSVVDSGVFLWLAFGSFEYLANQVAGKWIAVLIVLPLAFIARRRFTAATREQARATP